MSVFNETLQDLQSLPRTERRNALEALVIAEFQTTLPDAGEIPVVESFFALGFTPTGMTEVRDRLESLLGRTISVNVLFNSPTIGQLMDYLTSEVLVELFEEPAVTRSAAAQPRYALWDIVMKSVVQA